MRNVTRQSHMSAEVPRSDYKWRTKVVIKWFVRIFVMGLILLLIINSFVIKADQEIFSPAQWGKTSKRERHVYLEDLTKRLHAGMTINEVTAMLGDPDYQSKDGAYITYVVGGSQGMFSFSAITILDIRFKNGRIERALTRED